MKEGGRSVKRSKNRREVRIVRRLLEATKGKGIKAFSFLFFNDQGLFLTHGM